MSPAAGPPQASRAQALPGLFAGLALGAGAWSTGGAMVCGALALAAGLVSLRRDPAGLDRGVLPFLIAVAASAGIGLLVAPDRSVALGQADSLWPLLALPLAPTFCASSEPARAGLRTLMIFAAVAALAGGYATLQKFGLTPPPRHVERGFPGTSRLIPFRDVLALAAPATTLLLLLARRAGVRALAAVALVLVLCGLWVARGRGELAAACLGISVVLVLHRPLGGRRWVLALVPPLALALFSVLGWNGFDQLFGLLGERELTFSERVRMAHWESAWHAFREHPFLGVGIGNFAQAIADAPGLEDFPRVVQQLATSQPVPPPHAHSLPLHILATQGLLGAIPWALLLVYCARRYCADWRSDCTGGALGLGAMTVFLWNSLTDQTLFFTPRFLPYLLLLAVGLGMCRPAPRQLS